VPPTDPELPADLSGSTFSHVFGTRTSPLELFLLEREIRGPSWLIIKSPQFTNRPMSWCKLELSVEKALHISNEPDDGRPAAAPPLAVMCLSLKTFMNHVKGGNEIAVVSAVIYPNLDIDDPRADAGAEHARFTCVRKLDAMPYPQGFAELAGQQSQKIEVAMNERALLSFLMSWFRTVDLMLEGN
jgi:DNA polymerase alpha subunit A